MLKKFLFILVITTLALAACGARVSYEEEMASSGASGSQSEVYKTVSMDDSNAVYSQGISPTTERMVVKDVQIGLAVDDPEASAVRIRQMAEAMGGYVVSMNMYQRTLENGIKVPQGHITVRVPSERLNEAMDEIKAETSQPILSENVNSQDVTGEYTDLSSRLRNLEAAETKLQEIMDEATKTEDVLSVYSQLVITREQIELIKGQMQYYEQAAALSSIQVELVTNEAIQPLSIGNWQPKGVAKDAVQTLINTLKWLANAAIWIVIYILPTAIVIFGPIGLIIWGVRRAIKKVKKTTAITPPEG